MMLMADLTTLNWNPDGELKRPLWDRRNLNRLHSHGPTEQTTTDPADNRRREDLDKIRRVLTTASIGGCCLDPMGAVPESL